MVEKKIGHCDNLNQGGEQPQIPDLHARSHKKTLMMIVTERAAYQRYIYSRIDNLTSRSLDCGLWGWSINTFLVLCLL